MRLKGKNLAVLRLVNGAYVPIGLSTSCTIDIDTEMVEMAGMTSKFRSFKPGRHTVTIQCDRMIDTQPIISDHVSWLMLQLQGALVTYQVSTVEDGSPYGRGFQGSAYVSHQSLNGSVDGYATHSITLQGSGDFTFATTATTSLEDDTL